MTIDRLWRIKNMFYVGNYELCAKLADSMKVSSVEKDIYYYRSLTARGDYKTVLAKLDRRVNVPHLRYIRLLACYLVSREPMSDPAIRLKIVSKLKKILKIEEKDWLLSIVAANILECEGDFNGALEVVECDHVESCALKVRMLLQAKRMDAARAVFEQMVVMDPTSVLTDLTEAQIYLQEGGESIMKAEDIFRDLIQKHGDGMMLRNFFAICRIYQMTPEFLEAEVSSMIARGQIALTDVENITRLAIWCGLCREDCTRITNMLQEMVLRQQSMSQVMKPKFTRTLTSRKPLEVRKAIVPKVNLLSNFVRITRRRYPVEVS